MRRSASAWDRVGIVGEDAGAVVVADGRVAAGTSSGAAVDAGSFVGAVALDLVVGCTATAAVYSSRSAAMSSSSGLPATPDGTVVGSVAGIGSMVGAVVTAVAGPAGGDARTFSSSF